MVASDDFWKDAGYDEASWKKHKGDVEEAKRQTLSRFPQLKGRIKHGLGALSAERIEFKPEEKHESDLMIHKDYKRVCDIEVTGSDKIIPGPTVSLWILDGKYNHAKSSGVETWFWMHYPRAGKIYILSLRTVSKYENNKKTVYIKKDPKTGRGIPETYIEIPFDKAVTVDDFFIELQKLI